MQTLNSEFREKTPSHILSLGTKMDKYVYQLATRLDGKYYCRIYQFGIADTLATTDDYDEQVDTLEAAEALIQEYQSKVDDK